MEILEYLFDQKKIVLDIFKQCLAELVPAEQHVCFFSFLPCICLFVCLSFLHFLFVCFFGYLSKCGHWFVPIEELRMRGGSNTEADATGNLKNISLNFSLYLYLCGSRGGNINTQKVQSSQLQRRRKRPTVSSE